MHGREPDVISARWHVIELSNRKTHDTVISVQETSRRTITGGLSRRMSMRSSLFARPKTAFALLWLGGALFTYMFAEPMQLRIACRCGTGRK
jgi:hypothetical protein